MPGECLSTWLAVGYLCWLAPAVLDVKRAAQNMSSTAAAASGSTDSPPAGGIAPAGLPLQPHCYLAL
jgi:hypothetical protein